MKHLLSTLLIYFLFPITGTGTETDPYRANVPALLKKLIPNIALSEHVPSNANGTPKFGDVYVWIPIPAGISLPPGISAIADGTARSAIKTRDPNADPDAMERTK